MSDAAAKTPLQAWAALASLALSVLPSGMLLVVPVYSSGTTLVGENGTSVIAVLSWWPSLAGLSLMFARSSHARVVLPIMATLALLATIITGFTIGMFYVPATVALLVSAGLAVGER